MKTVYFVRHGESTANAGFSVYQAGTSELTEEGRKQADFIAKRCKKLTVDVLLSSTMKRAKDTAHVIAKEIGKEVEMSDLFTERRLPQELIGRPREDPDAKEMETAWFKSFLQTGIRVGSGENFDDLKKRAVSVLQYLKDRPENHILVVTHGYFLHMLIAIVLLGESITPEEFSKVAHAVWVDNTGLSRIEYRDEVLTRIDDTHYQGWVLRVWNDHAHLG